MRKRIAAFILTTIMLFESVPVSAAETLREVETDEIYSEFSMEEESLNETLTKSTSAESDVIESTVSESAISESDEPEDDKIEGSSEEEEILSTEEGQGEQTETETVEIFSETEDGKSTETESVMEDSTEAETGGILEELPQETGYEAYPDAIIPFEVDGTIYDGLDRISTYRSSETAAKYDPRVEAPEEMTPVRDQNPQNTCWAFAAVAAMEISAIRQGIADNDIDLSERHLAYFVYNSGFDALGNAEDDRIESSPSSTYLDQGGNSLLAAVRLMNWQGAALEEDYPYFNNSSEPPSIPRTEAQNREIIAHDVYFVRTSSAEQEEKVRTIKKLISAYGCVDWSYAHIGKYYNAEHHAYYNPNEGVNHDVTVVGWDDDFPAEYFGNSEGQYRPNGNGAWIVKNSWGEDWGEQGYFYISYEDASLENCTVVVAADQSAYDNNYFYGNTDFVGVPSSLHTGSISVMRQVRYIAQVFQANSGASKEKLTAISMMSRSSKLEYSIQIYKIQAPENGVITDPQAGEVMLQTPITGKTGYPGLYTIDLPEPVILSKGEYFSVVITFASEHNKYIYDDSIYMDGTDTRTYKNSNGETFTVSNNNTTNAGQSFYKEYAAYSEWKDTHKQGFNYRINALTVDNTCNVTFLDADGHCIDTVEVEIGMDAVPPTAPEREGYIFKGWSGSCQNITEDKELTAEYDPVVYTITYNLDGGTNALDNPQSYTIQTNTISIKDPVRTGYLFMGWYKESDYSGDVVSKIAKGSTGNLMLYAKWTSDTGELINPFFIPQSGIIEEGQSIIIKSNADAQIYYTLDGTTPTKESGILYNNGIGITKDVTLKAISVLDGDISSITEASFAYYKMRLILSETAVSVKKRGSRKLDVAQLPTTKEETDVQWNTSNDRVALVSEEGMVTGVSEGTAFITAETRDYTGNVVKTSCRVTVTKADDIAEGSYKSITWYIDENGKLAVEGRGDFAPTTLAEDRAPWYEYREKIVSAQINVTEMTDATNMFYGCSNLSSVDFSGFDTSFIVYMCRMFKKCSSLEYLDLSRFNTGNVTQMWDMFNGCSSLKEINLKNFDTQKVQDMSDMFNGCSSLRDLDVGSFDTEKVIDMTDMFADCCSLQNISLSHFDTINVTNMWAMFSGCSSLKSLNLSSFDVSKLKDAYYMLNGCDNLKTINTPCNLKCSVELPGSYWCMSDGTAVKELPQNLGYSVEITLSPNIAIGSYKNINWLIDEDGKLTVEGNGDFSNSQGAFRAPWSAYGASIKSAEVRLTGVVDASYMFYGCSELKSLDLSGFDASNIKNARFVFEGCKKLTAIYTPCNLTQAIELPVNNKEVWYQYDGTIITQLPQDLEYSILITKNTQPDTPEPSDKEYTVTFDLQGHGSELEEYFGYTQIQKGSIINCPTSPESARYKFTGWYKDAQCTIPWNFATDTVEENTTLYAGWESVEETEPGTETEIETETETGTEAETTTETETETETITEIETETITESETESETDPTTEPEKTTYTITFELQGHGMVLEEYSKYTEIEKGSLLEYPTPPTAEGYKFTGWYKDEQCTVLWDFETDTVEGDIVLYAGWKPENSSGHPENPDIPAENIPDGIWIAEIEDYTYTGKAIMPSVNVYYNKKKLERGIDYTIAYQNNTKAAMASAVKAPTVIVKGKGNYSGTRKAAFTINKVQLTAQYNLNAAKIYPSGVKYTPVVTSNGNVLKSGTDYKLTYYDDNNHLLKKQPTKPGNYQMRITGKGSCEGEISFTYSVSETGGANRITQGTAIVENMIYGSKEPNVTLSVDGKTLTRDTDYMVNFVNIDKKGTATATFIGIGSYTGTLRKNFKVQAATIQEKDITVDGTAPYEKGGAKASVSVIVGDRELIPGTDYTVSYKKNAKVGSASVTIKGKGNYKGNAAKTFTVEPQSLTAKGIRIFVSDVLSGKKPTVTIYDVNGKKLSANSDYNIMVDKTVHQVIITGGKNGLYTVPEPVSIIYQELEKGRQVTSVALNKKAAGFPKYFEYTGKAVELEKDWLTVKAGKTRLKSDEFEIVSYVNNIEKGTATVVIQGIGGYGGIKILTFKIKAKKLL